MMISNHSKEKKVVPSPQHASLDDLELRPPLLAVGADISISSRDDRSVLHPLLCRMFVASHVLKLSNEARFSALVLLHRYYNVSPSENVDWKFVAAACLFLGTKAEEESRRLRDILNVADMLEFGAHYDSSDVKESIHVKDKPLLLDEEYWKAKEQLVATEQKVLRCLKFDVCVSHPHRAVAVLLSECEFQNKQEILPLTWRYLNQALFYAPALRHDVLTLACASIECARDNLFDKQNTTWWHKYGVKDDSIQTCIKELQHSATI